MMYTVSNTTATSATLPNLQCNTEYTIWVYARGGLNDTRSDPRMVTLPIRGVYIHEMKEFVSVILIDYTPLQPLRLPLMSHFKS